MVNIQNIIQGQSVLFFVFVSFFSTTPQYLSRSTKDWIITKVIHVLNEHLSVMKNKVSYVLICKAPAQIQLNYFIFKLEACLKTTQKCRWKIFVDCTVYCHKSWKYHWSFWTKNQNFFFTYLQSFAKYIWNLVGFTENLDLQ